jgi:hypothetical protein
MEEIVGTVEVTLNKFQRNIFDKSRANSQFLGRWKTALDRLHTEPRLHTTRYAIGHARVFAGNWWYISDPNQLHGELNDRKTGIGRLHKETYNL